MILNVLLVPGSSQQKVSKIKGIIGDEFYKVWTNAKPIGGDANKSLIKILAKYLNKKTNEIKIVSGFKSRHKKVEIL